MATKEKNTSDKKENSVMIAGFLKENNLELVTDANGNQVVRGSLTISTSNTESHRVQFYVKETSKAFEGMLDVLPDNTVSIASHIKNTPGANFDDAVKAATKIWALGSIEEYAKKTGEREDSRVSIRGSKAGLSKVQDDPSKITPKADFAVDVYIENMCDETDENDNETGRVILTALIPKYDDSVDRVDFVTDIENHVSEYIKKNYSVGDTVKIKGELVDKTIIEEVEPAEEEEDDFFGKPSAPKKQYNTTFIHERLITGGSKKTLKEGEEGALSKAFIKKALVKREEKMVANGKKNSQYKESSAQKPTSQAKATAKAEEDEDMDF